MKKAVILAMVLALAVCSAAALTGCGESEQQAKENLATDLQELNTDLGKLVNPSTYSSLDSFNAVWKEISDQYEKTVAAAKKVKDIELADVESSYEDLNDAIDKATSGDASLQENITSVIGAVQEFLTSLDALNKSVMPNQ